MMPIIVHDHDPIGFTSQMKATLYPGISRQRFPDKVHRHIQFSADRNGHKRVGNIVSPWHRQTERAQIAPTELRPKLSAPLVQMNLCRKEVRRGSLTLTKPISLITLHDVREERPETIVVGAQHGQPIERHLIDELEKTLVDALHAAVMIEMFPVEIRNRDNGRRETKKRPVTLISFRHKEIASTKAGMTPQRIHFPPD